MANNNKFYEVTEDEKLQADNYPPGVEEHLQDHPFANLNNDDSPGRMEFMHGVFGEFFHTRFQDFVQQRRADPSTRNAPNGMWERLLTQRKMDTLLGGAIASLTIRGKKYNEMTVEDLWKHLVPSFNGDLKVYSYLWSPKYQKLTAMFTEQEKYDDENENAGQGKPKKCRKCGLYKY